MLVDGDEVRICEYCGAKLAGETQIFCTLPYRNSNGAACGFVCSDCRESFLSEELPEET